jgi:hypothetical protein
MYNLHFLLLFSHVSDTLNALPQLSFSCVYSSFTTVLSEMKTTGFIVQECKTKKKKSEEDAISELCKYNSGSSIV